MINNFSSDRKVKTSFVLKPAKLIVGSFISFSIISYIFTVTTGSYNGDYIGYPSQLSSGKLILNLIFSILPFFVLYAIYKTHNKRSTLRPGKVSINLNFLLSFLFCLTIFNLFVTLTYGYGKMGEDIYQAPTNIKLFIQVLGRFDLVFGVFILCLLSDNRKNLYVFLFLMIVNSLSASSLGTFIYIPFILIIKFHSSITSFIKKNILLIAIFISACPLVISTLYEYRDFLRQGVVETDNNTSPTEVVFGKLIGRLSSFANSAIIMERKEEITKIAQSNFSFTQFQKEGLVPFHGKIAVSDSVLYTTILLDSEGVHSKTSSFMTGTQGSLLIGYYQSLGVFICNSLFLLFVIHLGFFLASFINCHGIMELLLTFFCFSVMSGVAGEYTGILLTTLLYFSLFVIFNSIKKIRT